MMGEPGEDGLNTDHRYPIEIHNTKDSVTLTGELHDVAVWLASHYWQLDEEDRLYPLVGARVVED
jgi:hypothetical protein